MRKPELVSMDGLTIVVLGPEYTNLDPSAIREFQTVQSFVEEQEPPRMVIDLSPVSLIAPEFLNFLKQLRRELGFQIDGNVGLCCVAEDCREHFVRADDPNPIEIFATRQEAIATYARLR